MFFFSRYLYTGVMPLPRKGTGVIPIFYFILASHDEKSFELCLHKFYNDARKIRDQTPGYKHQRVSPYQCITDMSLVIFRPCLEIFNNGSSMQQYQDALSCGDNGPTDQLCAIDVCSRIHQGLRDRVLPSSM